MITIKLSWWIWNQMFEFATAKSLAKKYNTKIILDKTFINNKFFLNNHTYRNYELESVFWIKEDETFFSKLSSKYNIINKLIHPFIYQLIYKSLFRKKYIKENNWKFIENIWDNTYLDWYWQNSKYFENIENDLKDIFIVKTKISKKNQEILDQINRNFKNSVSIHIRRWDYITNSQANSWHWTCSQDYYNKAITYIKNNIDNPFFIIFSDDMHWVKQNMFFWENNIFIEWNSWEDDLRLMYNCGNHIIANSSFSWWWAYLWKNPNKIVIAPKKWLNNENYDYSNILLSNWIKL